MDIQISYQVIVGMLLVHWFADFVLQTDWQAKNKSKNYLALLAHVSTYSAVWAIAMMAGMGFEKGFQFTYLTFFAHGLTDFLTSKLNTYLYDKGKIHEFFVSVGFDQVLHFVQIFGTYLLLR